MSSTLNHIMQELCERAAAQPTTAAMRRLKKGLRVIVKQSANRQGILVAIGRDDTYPSTTEWNTVVNHMPYQVPIVTPRKEHKNGRYYLTARIPSNPQPRLL